MDIFELSDSTLELVTGGHGFGFTPYDTDEEEHTPGGASGGWGDGGGASGSWETSGASGGW